MEVPHLPHRITVLVFPSANLGAIPSNRQGVVGCHKGRRESTDSCSLGLWKLERYAALICSPSHISVNCDTHVRVGDVNHFDALHEVTPKVRPLLNAVVYVAVYVDSMEFVAPYKALPHQFDALHPVGFVP